MSGGKSSIVKVDESVDADAGYSAFYDSNTHNTGCNGDSLKLERRHSHQTEPGEDVSLLKMDGFKNFNEKEFGPKVIEFMTGQVKSSPSTRYELLLTCYDRAIAYIRYKTWNHKQLQSGKLSKGDLGNLNRLENETDILYQLQYLCLIFTSLNDKTERTRLLSNQALTDDAKLALDKVLSCPFEDCIPECCLLWYKIDIASYLGKRANVDIGRLSEIINAVRISTRVEYEVREFISDEDQRKRFYQKISEHFRYSMFSDPSRLWEAFHYVIKENPASHLQTLCHCLRQGDFLVNFMNAVRHSIEYSDFENNNLPKQFLDQTVSVAIGEYDEARNKAVYVEADEEEVISTLMGLQRHLMNIQNKLEQHNTKENCRKCMEQKRLCIRRKLTLVCGHLLLAIDIALDITLASVYIFSGYTTWGVIILSLLLVLSLPTMFYELQCLKEDHWNTVPVKASLGIYQTQQRRMNFASRLIFLLRLSVFEWFLKCWKLADDTRTKSCSSTERTLFDLWYFRKYQVLSKLRLFGSFLRTVPQLLVQFYILQIFWDKTGPDALLMTSITTSLISLSWCFLKLRISSKDSLRGDATISTSLPYELVIFIQYILFIFSRIVFYTFFAKACWILLVIISSSVCCIIVWFVYNSAKLARGDSRSAPEEVVPFSETSLACCIFKSFCLFFSPLKISGSDKLSQFSVSYILFYFESLVAFFLLGFMQALRTPPYALVAFASLVLISLTTSAILNAISKTFDDESKFSLSLFLNLIQRHGLVAIATIIAMFNMLFSRLLIYFLCISVGFSSAIVWAVLLWFHFIYIFSNLALKKSMNIYKNKSRLFWLYSTTISLLSILLPLDLHCHSDKVNTKKSQFSCQTIWVSLPENISRHYVPIFLEYIILTAFLFVRERNEVGHVLGFPMKDLVVTYSLTLIIAFCGFSCITFLEDRRKHYELSKLDDFEVAQNSDSTTYEYCTRTHVLLVDRFSVQR